MSQENSVHRSSTKKTPIKIAFIHPDLGIGGAERLVVDAAVGLQSLGKEVVVFTSHCDKKHCFEEIRDGTIKVKVYGDWLPSSIFGRLSIFCSSLRQVYLTMILLTNYMHFDAIIVDQLSTCVPFLLLASQMILFYCHFPDKYLAKRGGILKKLYRIPFDTVEAESVRLADRIVVNSKFTASVFKKAFPKIRKPLRIVHPCVDIEAASKPLEFQLPEKILQRKLLISVNRFERKKDIRLAIDAFSALRDLSANRFPEYLLLVAGGYDIRVSENRRYLKELQEFCEQKDLSYTTVKDNWDNITVAPSTNVLFLLSVPSKVRDALISSSRILLYTPENEHFGIVPLEAMLRKVPVLAQTNGGPLETVIDGKNGWLRPRDAKIWGNVIYEATTSTTYDTAAMGEAGSEWVKNEFSTDAMARKFESEIMSGIRSITPEKRLMRRVNGLLAVFVLFMLFWGTCIIAATVPFAIIKLYFAQTYSSVKLGFMLGTCIVSVSFLTFTVYAKLTNL
ncbi:mannosyltransferase complex subunit Alg2 [Schizosaccharomyces pombe]|uniref:Alpha-1,3/1,6-mannosyltransferase alg2 n=1 Tax=Schizosaccharomyces pombe (strain 972 / ATCC 24843) TaxID=284812 RepID=ALG2_SCHPO|nr:putative mannosyltransferase complex subunit Alg2 [Schizosaccharomyces pombe]Q96WW6.2 RecName: Full=Alpha-1,3/1,6-mannosyltransferase alg2; AltName: Full=Asparagine-linked glycosylation protein 2; AltName: Full=GDP-Man:Man(1)GlcNAc(2)-PP-Dol alpha-1,3-mannosyltransferase; AltName: Full=GDP-Man:Man(1)GlcNAc(2)-PP-dolichol mannosyltransferase; AltName: Full=GDP-Man:Man(2)GlcNAc(2)-PP-Dol alpha-1,6-mannosyltransferase [Schizosaccharomyces pombe 972h-]BAA21387.2 glycosyltransferase [Schizosaccharo|eukprot:NP_595621.3 putative mannosyltransferase complex subunit Alg2 [Schizosaccharomyces pombe]